MYMLNIQAIFKKLNFFIIFWIYFNKLAQNDKTNRKNFF